MTKERLGINQENKETKGKQNEKEIKLMENSKQNQKENYIINKEQMVTTKDNGLN